MSRRAERKRRGGRSEQPAPERRRCGFDELPPEVLEMVLRFLPYRVIAGPVRLVSKKCSAVATSILNSAFLSLGTRLLSALERADSACHTSSDAAARALQYRVRGCLECARSQWELMRACCWRYTRLARLCFYAGAILDELDCLLAEAASRPDRLLQTHRPDDLAAMCKAFMNYFESVSERRVNRSSLVSGCKAVDVLDCLLVGREQVSCRVSGRRRGWPTSVSMRLRYVLRRAWFTCLELPGGRGRASWRDQQCFMYLRLRRLVAVINEHHLETRHYEELDALARESELLDPPRALPCSKYSGYGEFGNQFFYYGNMNEYAFESKVLDPWRSGSARDRLRKHTPVDKPSYDLVVDVELKCSPELAPLSVRSMLKCDDFESATRAPSRRPEIYLKLSISCPASASSRLPGSFVWELRNPRNRRKAD